MPSKKNTAIIFAIAAAAFYALNIPLSKYLLAEVPPTLMAAFLYFGAGAGVGLVSLGGRVVTHLEHKEITQNPLTKKELPFVVGMVVLDIAAPICLMVGLNYTTAANASLLNNFEIVVTSMIAFCVFKETVSRRLWMAIGFVTLSSLILSFEDISSLSFSYGSLFVLLACICWGLENNCTRMISGKSAAEIVTVKGLFSGLGSLIIALCLGEAFPHLLYLALTMVLGFVAYGLSIYCYVTAQRDLGAAKTGAYYAISPFLGVLFSFLLFRDGFTPIFFVAFTIMGIGTYFVITDSVALLHKHEHVHCHTHPHEHNGVIHTHEHSHQHCHDHIHANGDHAATAHNHHHDDLTDHHHQHPAGALS